MGAMGPWPGSASPCLWGLWLDTCPLGASVSLSVRRKPASQVDTQVQRGVKAPDPKEPPQTVTEYTSVFSLPTKLRFAALLQVSLGLGLSFSSAAVLGILLTDPPP